MNADTRRRIEVLLDREIDLARDLAAALAEEKTALTGTSPQAVEQKAAAKVAVLEAIEKLEEERRALCAAPNAPGIAATVLERWRALMDLLAGCRNANDINGQIIHLRQNQVRQLIEIVRGGPAVTYDPQGNTVAKGQRALARA